MSDELTEEQRIFADMRKLTPAQRLHERMGLKAYAKRARKAKRNQDRINRYLAKHGAGKLQVTEAPVQVPHVDIPDKT